MSTFYRREVDGLRAVAVVPVVLYHAGVSQISGGFLGVDVFFVISGYLITSLLLRDLERGEFSIGDFYERRARRILPALFVVLGTSTVLAWFWMLPADLRQFSQSLVSVVVFASNVFFFLKKDYFADTLDLHPLLHTWSLAVEEQFYVIFPLILLLLVRKGARSITSGLIVLLVGSLAFAHWTSENMPQAGFYLIFSRAWELLAGALCALMPRQDRARSAGLWTLVGFAGLLAGYVLFDASIPHPSLLTIAPVAGTCLIILFSGQCDPVGKLLSTRPFVWIGLISYSLYLWHYPLLVFAEIRDVYGPSPDVVAALVVASFVLAGLTWRFVEQPFRRRRTGAFGRRGIFAGAVALSVTFLGIGMAVLWTGGAPDRPGMRHLDLAAIARNTAPNRGLSSACNGEMTLSSNCATSDRPRVAIWGDSFAMHLVEGLVAAHPDIAMVQLTKSLCPPLVGIALADRGRTGEAPQKCLEFNARALEYIETTESIDIVILSSAFNYLFDPKTIFSVGGLEPGQSAQALVSERLVEILDRIRAAGKMPIVVSSPPTNGRDIGHCIVNADFHQIDRRICDFHVKDMKTAMVAADSLLRGLKTDTKIVWLDQLICGPDQICRASEGSTSLYRDEGHLSVDGSRLLGQRTDGWFVFHTRESHVAGDTGAE